MPFVNIAPSNAEIHRESVYKVLFFRNAEDFNGLKSIIINLTKPSNVECEENALAKKTFNIMLPQILQFCPYDELFRKAAVSKHWLCSVLNEFNSRVRRLPVALSKRDLEDQNKLLFQFVPGLFTVISDSTREHNIAPALRNKCAFRIGNIFRMHPNNCGSDMKYMQIIWTAVKPYTFKDRINMGFVFPRFIRNIRICTFSRECFPIFDELIITFLNRKAIAEGIQAILFHTDNTSYSSGHNLHMQNANSVIPKYAVHIPIFHCSKYVYIPNIYAQSGINWPPRVKFTCLFGEALHAASILFKNDLISEEAIERRVCEETEHFPKKETIEKILIYYACSPGRHMKFQKKTFPDEHEHIIASEDMNFDLQCLRKHIPKAEFVAGVCDGVIMANNCRTGMKNTEGTEFFAGQDYLTETKVAACLVLVFYQKIN